MTSVIAGLGNGGVSCVEVEEVVCVALLLDFL